MQGVEREFSDKTSLTFKSVAEKQNDVGTVLVDSDQFGALRALRGLSRSLEKKCYPKI